MAKGAATEGRLGALHDKITKTFQKILDRYDARLDAIDSMDRDEIEDEFLQELFNENAMPNPAMLSAITKFLKDNDIGFDSEEIEKLSSTERRLEERRNKRGNITKLTRLKAVGDE